MDSLIASELQQIDLERCHGVVDCYAGTGSKDGATVIDMEYSEEDFDPDDDEKALMDQQAEQSGSVR
jgi:hypothetical protein